MADNGQPQQSTAVTAQAGDETPQAGETPTETTTFETWFSGLDAPLQQLVNNHTAGLRSALESERTERKNLSKTLKELSGKLEANSEAAKQVDALRSQIETTTRRAEFVEEAAVAGCTLPRAAWHIAQAENLTVAQMRQQYPQLFAAVARAPGGAGAGVGQPPAKTQTMNDWIRRAAGKE